MYLKKRYYRAMALTLSSCLLLISCSDSTFPEDGRVSSTNFTQTEAFSFIVSISAQNKLVLNAINGTITIGVGSDSVVVINGHKQVDSESEEDARNYINNLRVIYEPVGGEVQVRTEQPPNNFGRNLIVNYEILLPSWWSLEINQTNGDVKVSNLSGSSKITMTNGEIILNNTTGISEVFLINGNFTGNIILPINGMCDVSVENGVIDLSIPVNTSSQFAAKVTNGTITINNIELQSKISTERSVSGQIGGGQGNIQLETTNGIIKVTGL